MEHKICVLIFSIMFVRNISYSKKNSAIYDHKYICLHVKYPLFLSGFNEENPSVGSRLVPGRRFAGQTDGRT